MPHLKFKFCILLKSRNNHQAHALLSYHEFMKIKRPCHSYLSMTGKLIAVWNIILLYPRGIDQLPYTVL